MIKTELQNKVFLVVILMITTVVLIITWSPEQRGYIVGFFGIYSSCFFFYRSNGIQIRNREKVERILNGESGLEFEQEELPSSIKEEQCEFESVD